MNGMCSALVHRQNIHLHPQPVCVLEIIASTDMNNTTFDCFGNLLFLNCFMYLLKIIFIFY